MKAEPKNLIRLDRAATADEIRAAVLSTSDPAEDCVQELLSEVASDTGGYVRVPALEFETSLMVEELMRVSEAWLN